jgi:hypothetical protein
MNASINLDDILSSEGSMLRCLRERLLGLKGSDASLAAARG